MGAGARVPGEAGGVREPSLHEPAVECAEDRRRHVLGRERVEVLGRVAAHLGEGGRVRGGHRAAARHRLERRQAEALVEAREDEARGACGTARGARPAETCPRDSTAFGQPRAIVALPGEDEAQLGPLPPHERERVEQPVVVLVRPAVGGVEEERLALTVVRREALVVDAEVDRADALGRQLVALQQRLPRVLGDRDHEAAPLHRPPVDGAPVRELGAREERGIELVLEVVHGRHGRRPRRRAGSSR